MSNYIFFVVIGGAYGVFAVMIMLVERPRKLMDPMSLLAFGFATTSVGFLLMASVEPLPSVVAVLGGNVLAVFGLAYQAWGLHGLSGGRNSRGRRVFVLSALLATCITIYYLPEPWRYAAAGHLLYAGLFGVLAWWVLKWPDAVRSLKLLMGAAFLVLVILYLARAAHVVITVASGREFTSFGDDLLGMLLGLCLYLVALTTGFGILMMRKRSSDDQLRTALEDQRTILDTLPTGLIIANARRIVSTNPAMEQMIGVRPGELDGHSARILYPSDEYFRTVGRELYRSVGQTGQYSAQLSLVKKSGQPLWAQVRARRMEEHDDPTQIVLSVTDITSVKHLQEKYERLATLDDLTGLANRRSFMRDAQEELAAAHRAGRMLVVALIDLDGFKAINDRHGHSIGDAALILFAQACRETLRETDHVARVGGDEFAVAMPDVDLEQAAGAMRRLLEVLSGKALPVDGGTPGAVAASVGLVQAAAGETLDDLLEHADRQMYLSKAAGGAVVSVRGGGASRRASSTAPMAP